MYRPLSPRLPRMRQKISAYYRIEDRHVRKLSAQRRILELPAAEYRKLILREPRLLMRSPEAMKRFLAGLVGFEARRSATAGSQSAENSGIRPRRNHETPIFKSWRMGSLATRRSWSPQQRCFCRLPTKIRSA